ncbi:MAG: alkaline phosphatase family protein [Erysipelotrichaceae bacterium]|nr:alkaline phosphatase family protein [Erysipelotrichaceae bacterium]
MKTVKPDYQTGLINLMASILKYHGCEPTHNTHPVADQILSRRYDSVFLLLIDGMGEKILEEHLPEDSFLRKHMITSMTTVYPSTTVAATTAVITGETPYETGWIGWHQYFRELDAYNVMFLSQDYYSGKPTPYDYAYKAVPLRTMGDKIRTNGYQYQEVYPPFRPNGVHSMEEMTKRLQELSETYHHGYLYAYWDKFDSLMHVVGPHDGKVKEELENINKLLEDLSKDWPENQLLLVIADHGQIEIETKNMMDHPELMACMNRLPSVEPRAICMDVKEEKKEEFKKTFTEYYGNDFILYTRDEWYREGYFGTGKKSERLDDFTGNFIAAAISDVSLVALEEGKTRPCIGDHAGLSEQEMMIPLIRIGG